jgi:hypothetical protein
MKMIRTFHPVGQGAFYSEEFFNSERNCVFRVVYDCGSLKNCGLQRNSNGTPLEREDIKERVKRAFPNGHGIDILFVSHFDEDHVNLIPCLKSYQIRRVILPLLSAEERYMLTGYHLSRSRRGRISDALNSIINSPEEYFGNDTKVTFVRPADGERTIMENEVDDEGVGVDDLPEEISSLTKISIGNNLPDNGRMLRWLLIPYNHKPERYSDLKNKLENVFGKGFQISNLTNPDFVIKELKNLRSCYKKLPEGINRNSMALYSGPHDSACSLSTGEVERGEIWGVYCPCDQFAEFWIDRDLRHEPSSIFHGCPGCLYTGDISLDDADLTRVFGRYVRNIGMVQLPHHGSLNSYGNGNLPIDGRVCVVTYGEKNQFGHPAFAVKRNVVQKGGLWVDVTETDESRFRVEFNV